MFKIKSGTRILCLEYVTVFLGFLLMYLFMVPQSDVFLFAHATDGSPYSVISYSLEYGNGRLLGNIIGIYLSGRFESAGFVVSLMLTLVVVLLNYLVFDNHVYSVFLMAILVAFPSPGMLGECYYLFAAFCNYVIPAVFFLSSVLIFKSICQGSSGNLANRTLLFLVSLLLAAGSCLFSENTTIVIVVVAVLLVIYHYLCTKRISLNDLLYVSAVLIGALTMHLIPALTDTGHKMIGYRKVASTPATILQQCVLSFKQFSDIFNEMYLLIFLLSLAMLLLCLKQRRFQQSLKKVQLMVFAVYPFLCTGLSMIEADGLIGAMTWDYTLDAVLVILFVVNILLTIILTEEKSVRLILWFFVIAAAASVAPMMVVNQSGYRTYYTTFICVLIMALWLLKQNAAAYLRNSTMKAELQRYISSTAAVCFLILSLVLLMQSVYNYDFYIIRTNYIAEKINAQEDYSVPCMPYDTISVEDSWSNIISFAFPSAGESEQTTVSLSAWDGYIHYVGTVVNKPIQACLFAAQNWEYKNPVLPDSLCG